jgi:acyl carrier protein
MEEIEVKLKKIVSKQLGVPVENINVDSKFIDDLGGDSLDTVEMVLAVEDEFGIEISEDAAENMYDINCVIQYLKSNS